MCSTVKVEVEESLCPPPAYLGTKTLQEWQWQRANILTTQEVVLQEAKWLVPAEVWLCTGPCSCSDSIVHPTPDLLLLIPVHCTAQAVLGASVGLCPLQLYLCCQTPPSSWDQLAKKNLQKTQKAGTDEHGNPYCKVTPETCNFLQRYCKLPWRESVLGTYISKA